MLKVNPVAWRFILDHWQMSFTYGIFYAIYEWLLQWPASWIIALLFLRGFIQSLLYRPNTYIEYKNGELSGPTLMMVSRNTLKIEDGIKVWRFLGRVYISDENNTQITFRKRWYNPAEYQLFKRTVLDASNTING